jgi:plasmid stabilization system protein ParE
MSGYLLGPDAEWDLDDLWEYIAQDSVGAADRLMAEIFEAFEVLARNPGMGHKREDLTTFPVLFWPVGNYLIIYRAAQSLVEIVAIAHGKRDIPAFLRRRGAE